MDSAARQPERGPVTPADLRAYPRPVEGGVSRRRFRAVMGLFPTGVALVSARAADGEDLAITANSLTSVSLDPLLLLVCVEHASRLHGAVLAAGRWGVSVLAADAEQVSRRFARRGHDTAAALAGVPHHRGVHSDALLLDGAIATVECRTWAAHPGGDHTVLIGEVVSLGTPRPGAAPLLWHRGRYGRPDPPAG